MAPLAARREFCLPRVAGSGVVPAAFDTVMVGGGGGLLALKARFAADDTHCDGGDDGAFGCRCAELAATAA